MGYYIEVPGNKGKAQQIVDLYGGEIIPRPEVLGHPALEGKAVICVVDNGPFEAAGLMYSEAELEEFSLPDPRPKTWLMMDRQKAHELAGYRG